MGRLSTGGVATGGHRAAVETGIASVAAMRDAIGPDVELMVDCHSFFDVPLAERVARRLEPQKLAWYEEPVAPERLQETIEIRKRIQQPMAGGEILFGIAGFAPLCRSRAVNVIMPDVKHCGGLSNSCALRRWPRPTASKWRRTIQAARCQRPRAFTCARC